MLPIYNIEPISDTYFEKVISHNTIFLKNDNQYINKTNHDSIYIFLIKTDIIINRCTIKLLYTDCDGQS